MRKSSVGDEKQYNAWKKRLKDAGTARDKEAREVWKPLYDGLLGSLCCGRGDADPVNGYAQFQAMVMPHYLGDSRECTFTVTKIWGGEDADAKLAAAERMGKQATALAKACGLYYDNTGSDAEMPAALWNHLWGMGVMLVGFNPPKSAAGLGNPGNLGGLETRPTETRPAAETSATAASGDELPAAVEIDLDAAEAEHAEKADAGLPWARSYDPRRCLFDTDFGDVRKSRWMAVDVFRTVEECRAEWPEFRDKWKKTAGSVAEYAGNAGGLETSPTGDGGGQDSDGCGGGVVRLRYVYALDPLRLLVIPDERSGVTQIIDERELSLGIEGLPVLLLGAQWVSGRLYPKPALADGHGAALAELEMMQTIRGAANKVRNGIITKDAAFADQLRKGDAHGVYTLDVDMPIDEAFKQIEIGALRKEFIDVANLMRDNRDRNLGTSDMALALREPGNPTATEASARQAAFSARLAGLVRPVRSFEAATHQRLLAIAFEKLALMDGLQLPVLGPGQPGSELIGFDVSRPMIGEMLDYFCDVHVADALTQAEEVTQLQNAAALLGQQGQALMQYGKMARLDIVLTEILRRSKCPRADEIIVDLPAPPSQAPPDAMQAGGMPGEEMAPEAPPVDDGGGELEQLYAALEQIPEGDPQEDAIIARIAELQGAAAVAA